MKKIALFIALVLVGFVSCLKDKTSEKVLLLPPDQCTTIVSYAEDIKPIIESSCKTQAGPGTGCHDAWIDQFSQIDNYIGKGTWQNRLFTNKDMPEIPNDWGIDSLSPEEIRTMKCWIDQGYPQN